MLTRQTVHPLSFPGFRSGLDRLFSDLFGTALDPESDWFGGRPFPALNVWEDDERLYLEAAVPGLSMDDLEVTVSGRELSLRGSRTEANPPSGTWRRRERQFGDFTRTLRLPTEVDPEQVEAELADGILLVTIGKSSASQARRIPVQTTAS